jgi:hypothetical protein
MNGNGVWDGPIVDKYGIVGFICLLWLLGTVKKLFFCHKKDQNFTFKSLSPTPIQK